MIPFDFTWWVWLLLSLGFGWFAWVVSDTHWKEGAGQTFANLFRLICVLACTACALFAVVTYLNGSY